MLRQSPAPLILLTLTATCLIPAAAQEGLPDIAAGMLDAAEATGDPDQLRAVADAAKAVFPDYADAIEANAAARIVALTPPEEVDPPAAPETKSLLALGPWEGKARLGAALSSGNSDNAGVGLAFEAERAAGDFTHKLTGYADIGRANGVLNQKRWGAAYKLDYNFSDRSYSYGRLAYDEDEFSGFDYRLFAGAGLGHFLSKSERLTWKLEGGPGFQYSPVDDTREVQQELALYAASETDWTIRDGWVFEQDVTVTWTDPTTTITSVTALTTALTDAIATGVSFNYRYETNPPPDRVNTDTVLRANLTYGF